MSKKISQLDIQDCEPKTRILRESYVKALEKNAHRKRAKQKKRYDDRLNNLEKECYSVKDILHMYNPFFGHELPISNIGFGTLKGTRKHFTHKRIKRNNKLITIYKNIKE